MAQLKDTLIQGSARVTDTLYGSTVELTSLVVPNADASSTYSAGSAGQVLTSNGSSVYWSSLGGAASYSVTDSSSASAIGTGTALVTERDVYYGLPTINNAHNYTSSTTIYAPTAGGTANYVLMGNGATAAPIWKTPKDALTVMINALDTGPSVLTSNDYIITQYVGGGTSNTTYYRRPASAVRVGGLLTARKLKVALGSTNDATFDGTADQTSIPVSGVLDIAHGGTGATTAAGIREALNLSSAMHFIGTTTTTMSDGLTTADITVNGDTHTPIAGDVVLYSDTEYVWTGSAWERLGRDSSFKTTQTAITKPTAATNKWVSAIGQDANGNITVDYSTLVTSGTWSGKATTAGTADKISNLTSTDNASNTATWRKVWISYDDGVTGRPAVSANFTYQTSTNTLKTRHFLADHISGGSAEFHMTYGTAIDFWMGVGSGNVNHGIYDSKIADWVLFAGSDNVWHLKGSADKLTDTVKLKVALGSTTDISFDGSADCLNIPISGTLEVPYGGTGSTSFTANSLIISGTNTTSPLKSLASGTAGYYLVSGGSDAPHWIEPVSNVEIIRL